MTYKNVTTKEALTAALTKKNPNNGTYWYTRTELEIATGKTKSSIQAVLQRVKEGNDKLADQVVTNRFMNPCTNIVTEYICFALSPTVALEFLKPTPQGELAAEVNQLHFWIESCASAASSEAVAEAKAILAKAKAEMILALRGF